MSCGSPLLAVAAFVSTSHTASATSFPAAKPSDPRTAALVAALQAVSPDPLGGRLGLAATAARLTPAPASPTLPAATAPRTLTEQATPLDRDQRAYLAWKSTQKS